MTTITHSLHPPSRAGRMRKRVLRWLGWGLAALVTLGPLVSIIQVDPEQVDVPRIKL